MQDAARGRSADRCARAVRRCRPSSATVASRSAGMSAPTRVARGRQVLEERAGNVAGDREQRADRTEVTSAASRRPSPNGSARRRCHGSGRPEGIGRCPRRGRTAAGQVEVLRTPARSIVVSRSRRSPTHAIFLARIRNCRRGRRRRTSTAGTSGVRQPDPIHFRHQRLPSAHCPDWKMWAPRAARRPAR